MTYGVDRDGTEQKRSKGRAYGSSLASLYCYQLSDFGTLYKKRMLSYRNFHLKVLFLNKIASYEVIALAWPCQYIVTILYAVNSDHIFTA